MVSASSQVQHIDSLWSIAQIIIGFGTVACMCCALFLGLKLKWFRAQFKVQDMPKTKKSSDTVQGIGFKIKSNSEDFQQYKSISEFATPEVNLSNVSNNKNLPKNIPKKAKPINEAKLINEAKASTTAKVGNSNKVLKTEKVNVNKEPPSIPKTKKKNVILEDTSSQIATHETLVDEYYKNETEIKTSVEKKSKVSFVKNKAHIEENKTEHIEENIFTTQQIRNPLSAQNIVMPQEDEDNWQIKIVDEKRKVQIDNRNDDIYYEDIHLANDSNSYTNSMYSSQAASIFFGSYDEKQPPDSPPPPIPRKFLEDNDAISMSSQTSA